MLASETRIATLALTASTFSTALVLASLIDLTASTIAASALAPPLALAASILDFPSFWASATKLSYVFYASSIYYAAPMLILPSALTALISLSAVLLIYSIKLSPSAFALASASAPPSAAA